MTTTMTTIRNLSPMKWFLAVLFACLVFPAANAQTTVKGKFHLQHQVRWGFAVLQPGDYSIIMESTPAGLLGTIRDADGKNLARVKTVILDDAAPEGSALFITANGREYEVRSLNLPQLGVSLIYKPLTRAERESRAANTQAVPVIVAKK